MIAWTLALSIASGLVTSRGLAEEKPPSPLEIQEQTREDILAGYRLLRDHHPGAFNPFDPTFASRLEKAKDVALSDADRALTAEDRLLASST